MRKFLPLSGLLLIFMLFLLPLLSSAAGIVPCGRNIGTPEEQKICTLCHFIIGFWNLINYGFRILVFVAFTGLVIAGIIYIVSAGSEETISTAKRFMKSILVGFGIVLAAWLFIFIVMNYFGVKKDLGIEKADGWTKFTCRTESSATIPPN